MRRSMLRNVLPVWVVQACLLGGLVLADNTPAKTDPAAKEPVAVEKAAGEKTAEATKDTGPSKDKAREAADRKKAAGKLRELDPEREAQALEFARTHHPELAELLLQLKSNDVRQYALGVLEVYRVRERLASLETKQPDRHAAELNSWKIGSRIRVLTARLTMKSDAELEQELRNLITQQVDLKVQELISERDQLAERVKALDAKIQDAQRDREQQVQAGIEKAKSSVSKLRAQRDSESSNKNKSPERNPGKNRKVKDPAKAAAAAAAATPRGPKEKPAKSDTKEGDAKAGTEQKPDEAKSTATPK